MTSFAVLYATLAQLVPAHLGSLHRAEAVLALVLAAAPFVVLAVVISIRRRRDLASDPFDQPSDQDAGL